MGIKCGFNTKINKVTKVINTMFLVAKAEEVTEVAEVEEVKETKTAPVVKFGAIKHEIFFSVLKFFNSSRNS